MTGKLTSLKVIQMNAQSIINKTRELYILVDQLEPDIIGISETWAVSDKHTDAELSQ